MTEHYYTEEPRTKHQERTIIATLRGQKCTFKTDSGTFSPRSIDKATMLLINYAPINDEEKVLDLGCGYGAVGISIAKTTSAHVTMSDVNRRAIKLSENNAKINHVTVSIIHSNGFENIPQNFDTILLNPPHSAGRELCIKLITESKKHLTTKGKLFIVAFHNKGGKYYEELLKKIFPKAETLCKKGGIRVYSGKLD